MQRKRDQQKVQIFAQQQTTFLDVDVFDCVALIQPYVSHQHEPGRQVSRAGITIELRYQQCCCGIRYSARNAAPCGTSSGRKCVPSIRTSLSPPHIVTRGL